LAPKQQGVRQTQSSGFRRKTRSQKNAGAPALAKTATQVTNGHDHYSLEDAAAPALA
jgi:hypothetical protein